MKNSFKPPAEGRIKDPSHIDYIAKRPGVDKGSLNPEDMKHLEYLDARPGSHGLFGNEEKTLEEVKEELKAHEGITWRAIISLREDDAVKAAYTEREPWEKLLHLQMSRVADVMGIDRKNLRWAAAFHQERGHPHVHVVFWERCPLLTRGKMTQGQIKEIKKSFASEIFREERLRHMQEKSCMREYVRSQAKRDLGKARELLKEIKGENPKDDLIILYGSGESSIPPPLRCMKELAGKLNALAEKMPGTGRAALKYMPAEVKAQARDLADYILKQPYFKQEMDRYLAAQEMLAKTYTAKPEQIAKARDRAYKDLQDRVANLVVRGAADINRIEGQERWGKSAKKAETGRSVNTVWKSCWRAVERERFKSEAQAEYQKRLDIRRQESQRNRPARQTKKSDSFERSHEE